MNIPIKDLIRLIVLVEMKKEELDKHSLGSEQWNMALEALKEELEIKTGNTPKIPGSLETLEQIWDSDKEDINDS